MAYYSQYKRSNADVATKQGRGQSCDQNTIILVPVRLRHDMEMRSALLTLCEGKPPGPETRIFEDFVDSAPLNKQFIYRWFENPYTSKNW